MYSANNNINNNLLHKLRDIHLPDPVSFYPLPMAWWVSLVIIILFTLGLWGFIQYTLKSTQRKALKDLKQLEIELLNNPDHEVIFMELSYLLKNYVRQQFPNTYASSLIGDDWLNFLDSTSKNEDFSQGVGQTLRTRPYQKDAQNEGLEVFTVVTQWVRKNPYKTKKKNFT